MSDLVEDGEIPEIAKCGTDASGYHMKKSSLTRNLRHIEADGDNPITMRRATDQCPIQRLCPIKRLPSPSKLWSDRFRFVLRNLHIVVCPSHIHRLPLSSSPSLVFPSNGTDRSHRTLAGKPRKRCISTGSAAITVMTSALGISRVAHLRAL